MTEEDKLYQAYYDPDRLWTGGKAIKELHKITSVSKKDIKSWLAKASPLAGSYTTSKGNKSSSLRCDNTQRAASVLFALHAS